MNWDNQMKFLSEQCEFGTYKGRMFMNRLDEASKVNLSDKVVSALYKLAISEFAAIDFGEIPDSKGDITKLKHYEILQDALDALNEIFKSTNNTSTDLQTINESFKIMQAYKKEFSLSFIQDKAMGVMIYNTIVLSIICGVNMCITSSVDYLRTPGANVEGAIDTQKSVKTENTVLIDNLIKFNISANNGDLKKLFDSILQKDNFIGLSVGAITLSSGVVIAAIALAAAIAIVPVTRELIHFFYDFRMKVSEYFNRQAEFLEINLAEVRSSNIKDKTAVMKKHEIRIKQLEKIANTFEVDFNNSDRKAKKELSQKIDPEKIDQILEPNSFSIV